MSEPKSVLVRVTIGDNLTCSFPEGNEVASMNGRVRFENFTKLTAEVRFNELQRSFHVTRDEPVIFKVAELGSAGKHEFTIHEVIEKGRTDDTVKGEGAIVIDA